MSLQITPLGHSVEAMPGNGVEGLITQYFDRAYLMFNLFVDDPRACLQLSESVFRTLDTLGGSSEQDVYALLVEFVRELAPERGFLPEVSTDSVLCWLLKDSAALSYAEIAALMELDRQQVGERIAEVRFAILG